MTWTYKPEIYIARREGRFAADLPGGEALRYDPHDVPRESGPPESICSTIDHIIAAAGW